MQLIGNKKKKENYKNLKNNLQHKAKLRVGIILFFNGQRDQRCLDGLSLYKVPLN